MNIKIKAENLIKKYKTNDPFELAECLNIPIHFMNYPDELQGLYIYFRRTSTIYINKHIPCKSQRVVCGHELGHAVLHHKQNSTFLKQYDFFCMPRHENEANLFCTYLLLPDDDLCKYENLTYEQIAAVTYIPTDYIKLRLNK